MKTVSITVTPKHWHRAVAALKQPNKVCRSCVLAQALTDALPGRSGISVWPGKGINYKWWSGFSWRVLPPKASRVAAAFDRNRKLPAGLLPVTFRIPAFLISTTTQKTP